jgi:hypothetical protein
LLLEKHATDTGKVRLVPVDEKHEAMSNGDDDFQKPALDRYMSWPLFDAALFPSKKQVKKITVFSRKESAAR